MCPDLVGLSCVHIAIQPTAYVLAYILYWDAFSHAAKPAIYGPAPQFYHKFTPCKKFYLETAIASRLIPRTAVL